MAVVIQSKWKLLKQTIAKTPLPLGEAALLCGIRFRELTAGRRP
jgi:hypothetical protein